MLVKVDAHSWASAPEMPRHALIWDDRDEEWALWRRALDPGDAVALVGWNGVPYEGLMLDAFAVTVPKRFDAYLLSEEHVAGLVMAAHHLDNEQAWYALCERTVNRVSTSVRQESTHADR